MADFGALPINYAGQLVNVDPMANYAKGASLADTIVQRDRADVAYNQQQSLQSQMKDLMAKPYVTSADIAPIIAQADPSHLKQFQDAFAMKNDTQQQNMLSQLGSIQTALQMGDNDAAISKMKIGAEAAKNSGDTNTSKQLSDLADYTVKNPSGSKIMLSSILSSVGPKGQAIVDNSAKYAKEQFEQGNYAAQSQIIKQNAEKGSLELANLPAKLDIENRDKEAQISERNALAAKAQSLANQASMEDQAKQLLSDNPSLVTAVRSGVPIEKTVSG